MFKARRLTITAMVPASENLDEVLRELSLSRDTGEMVTVTAEKGGIVFDLVLEEVEHQGTVLPKRVTE